MTSEYKDIRDMVFALCEQSALDVSHLYDNAIMDIANLMRGVEITENMPFNFEDYGLQDKVDEIMDGLEASITHRVEGSVIAAYGMSYKNCEKLIKRAVGEQVSAKVQKAFAPKLRSKAAAQAFMRNVPSVNGKLWNGETLALMTSAIEDSIRQGLSASKMATKIKQYLNDPDDWHRRFRYKAGEDKEGNPIYRRKWKKREWDEETGKYKWVDHKPGEPHPGHVGGPGAYRSSYKNALRYARTTTNMAYRTADYDLYQDLPFVIGIEIRLSNNHPIPDICDTLAGRYPKEFKWTGWHPNCRCYQIPILAKSSETEKMVDAILDDKDPSTVHCDGVIDDLPDNFKGWLTNNQERLNTAVSMGRLPYFLKDNGTIDAGVYTLNDFTAKMRPLTPMEIAQQRHAARTDEQVAQIQARADERSKRLKDYALTTKRADNIMGMQGEWHEVDFSTMSTLLTSVHGKPYYKAGEMADLKNALQGIKTQIMAQKAAETALSDVIPDVHKWHKQFTIAELQDVKDSIPKFKAFKAGKNYVSDWNHLPLAKQKQLLEDEMLYVADPNYLKPHTLHKTWQVAQAVYKNEVDKVEMTIQWKPVDAHLSTIQTYLKTHKNAKSLAATVHEAEQIKLNGGTPAQVEAKLQEADKKIATVQKSMAKKKGSSLGKPLSNTIDVDKAKALAESVIDAEQQLEDCQGLIRTISSYSSPSAADVQKLKDAKAKLPVLKKNLADLKSQFAKACNIDINAIQYSKWDDVLNDMFDDANDWFKTLTEEERHGIINYTEGSGKFNRPLRGYRGSWNAKDFVGIGKVPFDYEGAGADEYIRITEALERSKLKNTMWSKRGSDAQSFQGVFGTDIYSFSTEQEARKALIGRMGVDEGFMSTSPTKPWGGIQYHVYMPKGTEAGLVDPFSYYGGSTHSYDAVKWTELKRPYSIGEQEILLNRGYSYEIIDVRMEYGEWHVYMKVIDRSSRQNP